MEFDIHRLVSFCMLQEKRIFNFSVGQTVINDVRQGTIFLPAVFSVEEPLNRAFLPIDLVRAKNEAVASGLLV